MPATDEDGAEAGNALIGLAERVEALEGPDREVDAEIAETYWRYNCRNPIWDCGPVAAYTASLDAAMTLIPEAYGRALSLESKFERDGMDDCWRAILTVEGSKRWSDEDTVSHGANAALAVTACCLRARASEADRLGKEKLG